MKMTTLFIFLFISVSAIGQSRLEKLFKQKRYKDVITFAPEASKLGGTDIFYIGQSYMMLEQDAEALDMFEQAINKGYKDGEIYFAKGIVETNLKFYKNAETSFRQALFYMPNRKKVLIELAACYYKSENLDSALVTYQKIEANWGDYYPAVLMTCQIMHEQEDYDDALECYYAKLPMLKRDNFYYQQALESVMRIEWHHYHNYHKAEIAIKNLMVAFPDNYEYNMLMMQLYNYTGKYAEAEAQEEYILAGYKQVKLANKYYQKGAMVMEQFDSAQYNFEVYRNFQPEKNNDIIYKVYIFNYDGSRPLGRIEGATNDTISLVTGYAIDIPIETNVPMSYEDFKFSFLQGLFLPELPDNDTIPEE